MSPQPTPPQILRERPLSEIPKTAARPRSAEVGGEDVAQISAFGDGEETVKSGAATRVPAKPRGLTTARGLAITHPRDRRTTPRLWS
jgi:hypothetical protein